jgi:hypothetical protein
MTSGETTFMSWLPLLTTGVAWLVAMCVVLAVRGRQLSKRFCVAILVASTLGAGAMQFATLYRLYHVEAESAAQLASVTGLQLGSDFDFLEQLAGHLKPAPANDKGAADEVDWAWTFERKAQDIDDQLAAVERNTFLKTQYAVWVADVEHQRKRLKLLAERTVAADNDTARHTNFASFSKEVIVSGRKLLQLARVIRSGSSEPPL